MKFNVTREMCRLASVPLQSPLYKAVASGVYDYDAVVLEKKISVRDYPNRVLSCNTPDSIDPRDKKFKELCNMSVEIAQEMFGQSKTFAISNMKDSQVYAVIAEMLKRKLLI